jgi:hypothetical protein
LTQIGYTLHWLYAQGRYLECLDGALAVLDWTWRREDEEDRSNKLESKAETLDMAMKASIRTGGQRPEEALEAARRSKNLVRENVLAGILAEH